MVSDIHRLVQNIGHQGTILQQFLRIRQETNKLCGEQAVFQASLVVITPQICSTQCTHVRWKWHTIEWATYKLLQAKKGVHKNNWLVHLDSCDNTSSRINHQITQMGQNQTWKCFFCFGIRTYSSYKLHKAVNKTLQSLLFFTRQTV